MLRIWLPRWLKSKTKPASSRRVECRPRSHRLSLECLEDRTVPATITVTGIGDTIAVDGIVTLREAIASANGNANINADVVPVGAYGIDTINFNIAGAGVHTIIPTTALPAITDSVMIDGYTQPGASANTLTVGDNAVLLIEINGTNVASSGLSLMGGSSTIHGLVINRFGSQGNDGGIFVHSDNNIIAGNFIGLDTTGNTELGNAVGVRIASGMDNLIGGTTPAARNVISGNGSTANVFVDKLFLTNDPQPNGTLIRGNYIGTNAAGSAATHPQGFGNRFGVFVMDSVGTIIGGSDIDDGVLDGNVGARNVISGNLDGIHTEEQGTTYAASLTVQGNFIGVNAAGTAALGNFNNGIFFTPQRDMRSVNTITVGGTAAGAGNVISGNVGNGVSISNSNVMMQGNRIGTDLAGTLDLGNGFFGVDLTTGGSPPYLAMQFTVGGTTAAARNIISGNGGSGLFVINLTPGSTTVQGNYIGVQSDGVSPLGNDSNGIVVGAPAMIGGTGTGQGNVIAFSGGDGVSLALDQTQGRAPLLSNSIFANVGSGISGSTAPSPILTSSTAASIFGTLTATPNTTYRVEFFSTPDTGPTSNNEGKNFLGFLDVTTNAAGTATLTFSPVGGVPAGPFLTATATGPASSTSNFSAAVKNTQAAVPDLQISVSDGVTSTTPGSTLTYTLNYSNTGTKAATGVQLTETVPTGTSFNAAVSTAGWTQTAPGSGIYKLTVGNLAVGSGAAVFVVTVNNPAPQGLTQIVNTASIADDGTNGTDPTPADNIATDTDSLTSLSTDVKISNVVSFATIHAGDNLTFTLSVQNLGNNPAAGVTLTDAVPTGTTFVSFTASAGWTVQTPAVGSTGNVTATRTSLAAGAIATFQMVVRVNIGATVGTIITNSAQVATTSTDSDMSNNSASATSQVAVQSATRLTFTLVGRYADYRSELGLFFVDDAAGRIGTLRPGDKGYAQAALSRRQFYFNRLDHLGSTHTLDLPAGQFYGWYLVQNNTSARFLARNPNNRLGTNPLMFFSFKAANPDAFEHMKQIKPTQVRFEDQTKGGDRDYNDLIVNIIASDVPLASRRVQPNR